MLVSNQKFVVGKFLYTQFINIAFVYIDVICHVPKDYQHFNSSFESNNLQRLDDFDVDRRDR